MGFKLKFMCKWQSKGRCIILDLKVEQIFYIQYTYSLQGE